MAQTLAHPPFSSAIDPTFWAELAELKMTKLKLDSRPHPLHASYSSAAATAHRADGESGADAAAAAWMNLAGNAFAERPVIPPRAARASGRVVVVNTLEEFKGLDKKAFLEASGAQILADIDSGAAEKDPSLLVRCDGVVFSDLKNYKHVYWFAFPALCLPEPPVLDSPPRRLAERLPSADKRVLLHQGVQNLRKVSGEDSTPPIFLVDLSADSVNVRPLSELLAVAGGGSDWWLGFVDPSPLPSNPGWPLRNALMLVHRRLKLPAVSVLCYRDVLDAPRAPDQPQSILLDVSILVPAVDAMDHGGAMPKVVGWEANGKGKMGARMVDLAPFMDPARRAVESADLNLKLMRWRFLPDLDIDR